MNQLLRPQPSHVPTLTEVVELLSPIPVADLPAPPALIESVDAPAFVTSGLPAMQVASNWTPMSTVVLPEVDQPQINEAQLAQRVLSDVQRQLDGMLDYRLREAIGPILAKHADVLVRELHEELSRTMRDVVARSVSQELAKLRQR